MSHARTQIRAAVKTALTGLSGVGDRVTGWKTTPHELLPAIEVTTPEDAVDPDSRTKDGYETHLLTIRIEVRAKAAAGVEETLDDICADVEAELQADAPLNALVKDMALESTETTSDGEAEKEVGLAAIEYTGWYQINRNDPETIIT